MDTVGSNNPDSKEWNCGRKDCAPCHGREILGAEAEEQSLKIAQNQDLVVLKPEDKSALPSCTSEGVNYSLECLTCRKKGEIRQYLGETSRPGYQRGLEHMNEIEEGISTHPMVIHFWEDHHGRRQDCLMRILSGHLTPLDRQKTESINT